jgi:hypothetical protein
MKKHLAVLLLALAPACYAGPYIMTGQSTVKLVGTGAWYVNELPHQLDTRSLSWSIGWRGDAWRAGYVDFGQVSSDARAYYPDAAYAAGASRGCPDKGCAPENKYRGKFKTDGIFATFEPRFGMFTVGAGLALLRHQTSVTVDYGVGPNPYLSGPWTMATQGTTELVRLKETQVTYLLTAGLDGRYWSLTAQAYPNAFSTGGISKGVTAVFLGYKF